MALMKCPKCSHSVSDTADNCPKCNFAIRAYLAEQSKLKSEKAAEEQRKNAKCPECKQPLTWKGRHHSGWDSAPGYDVYGSYCTNCGYKDDKYRDFQKNPAMYWGDYFDPPESKPPEPPKTAEQQAADKDAAARARGRLLFERNKAIMAIQLGGVRPFTREDLEEKKKKIEELKEKWRKEDSAQG